FPHGATHIDRVLAVPGGTVGADPGPRRRTARALRPGGAKGAGRATLRRRRPRLREAAGTLSANRRGARATGPRLLPAARLCQSRPRPASGLEAAAQPPQGGYP